MAGTPSSRFYGLSSRDGSGGIGAVACLVVEATCGRFEMPRREQVVDAFQHGTLVYIYTRTQNVSTYTHIYIHTHMHTHTYIHKYIHTYIHTSLGAPANTVQYSILIVIVYYCMVLCV